MKKTTTSSTSSLRNDSALHQDSPRLSVTGRRSTLTPSSAQSTTNASIFSPRDRNSTSVANAALLATSPPSSTLTTPLSARRTSAPIPRKSISSSASQATPMTQISSLDPIAESGSSASQYVASPPTKSTSLAGVSSTNTDNSRIRVCVRVRPVHSIQTTQPASTVVAIPNSSTIRVEAERDIREYHFDYIADQHINQDIIHHVVGKSLCDDWVLGYNCTIFTYGQVAAGKSYTIFGTQSDDPSENDDSQGVIHRIIDQSYEKIRQLSIRSEAEVKMSMIEIHTEQITDLFSPSNKTLQLRETGHNHVFIEELSECIAKDKYEAFDLISRGLNKQSLLTHMRPYETNRSHTIVTMKLTIKSVSETGKVTVRHSSFNIVDLAGIERQRSSDLLAGSRSKEAGIVNKGLLSLGNVINSLEELSQGKKVHVPYRDSKLTHFLKESLGGNSRTWLIANIIPLDNSTAETVSTLKFAKRCSHVVNRAFLNEETLNAGAQPKVDQALPAEEINRIYAAAEARVNEALRSEMAAKERVIELEKKIFDLELRLEHKNQLLAEKDLECDHKLKDLEAKLRNSADILADQLKSKNNELAEAEQKHAALNQSTEDLKNRLANIARDHTDEIGKLKRLIDQLELTTSQLLMEQQELKANLSQQERRNESLQKECDLRSQELISCRDTIKNFDFAKELYQVFGALVPRFLQANPLSPSLHARDVLTRLLEIIHVCMIYEKRKLVKVLYRICLGPDRFVVAERGIIKIQSRLKMISYRQRYCLMKTNALLIQRAWRKWKKLKHALYVDWDVAKSMTYTQASKLLQNVLLIHKVRRSRHISTSNDDELFGVKSTLLQRSHFLTARVAVHLFEEQFLKAKQLKIQKRRLESAITIQRVWRGLVGKRVVYPVVQAAMEKNWERILAYWQRLFVPFSQRARFWMLFSEVSIKSLLITRQELSRLEEEYANVGKGDLALLKDKLEADRKELVGKIVRIMLLESTSRMDSAGDYAFLLQQTLMRWGVDVKTSGVGSPQFTSSSVESKMARFWSAIEHAHDSAVIVLSAMECAN